ncbi:SBBP repeat-containing protein [Stella sp.]|uniref:SBBP repeat-containing protein n=1 Tax=Stella sp. TaxID=2912054 RepID=UPI0035B259AB
MAFGAIGGQGSGVSRGYDVSIDASRNTYVTGYFSGTVDFDGAGSAAPLVVVGEDFFVVKYDADGNLLWVRNPGSSSSNDAGNGIAVDGSGNSYVTGYFAGTVDFDGAGSAPPLVAVIHDHFVLKYDAEGSVLWVRSPGSSSAFEQGRGIALDEFGNSHVTGYFSGTVDFDGAGSAPPVVALGYDHFVAK